MTPEQQQRIAIAEACGWKRHADSKWYVGHVHPLIRGGRELPDYLNDLNAMHEAEKVLTAEQYVNHYIPTLRNMCGNGVTATSATAAQRAEAFLKTLNLWKS